MTFTRSNSFLSMDFRKVEETLELCMNTRTESRLRGQGCIFVFWKKKRKHSKVFYCQVNFGWDGSRLVNQAYELRRALR